MLRGSNGTLKCAAVSTSTSVTIEWRKDNILVPDERVTNTGRFLYITLFFSKKVNDGLLALFSFSKQGKMAKYCKRG